MSKIKHYNYGYGFTMYGYIYLIAPALVLQVSIADLAIYNHMFMVRAWFGKAGFDPTQGRSLMDALFKRVEALPNIATWLKERPDSDF